MLLLRRRRAPLRLQRWGVALWLFSPLTATISTRGNGEALVTCLLLGLLLALDAGAQRGSKEGAFGSACVACMAACLLTCVWDMCISASPLCLELPGLILHPARLALPKTCAGHLVPAALLFGLAVHWRLYPIIFALPLLRHYALKRQAHLVATRARRRTAGAERPTLAARAWHRAAAAAGSLVSPEGVAFGALSGGLFLGLAALGYRFYGHPFLHETYLYHASRTDPRHNFSPYFYPAYLASGSGGDVGDGSSGGSSSWDVGW